MQDKMQDSLMERPKLFVSGCPNFMAVIVVAVKLAKEYGMDADKIRSECMEAGGVGGRAVLKRYFEVI